MNQRPGSIEVYVVETSGRYALAVDAGGEQHYRCIYHHGLKSATLRPGDKIVGRAVPARDGGPLLVVDSIRCRRPPYNWREGARATAAVDKVNADAFCFATDAEGGAYFVPCRFPQGTVVMGRIETPENGHSLPRLIPDTQTY